MKQMGLDMSEFRGGYNDPELAALDAKLKKQGKLNIYFANSDSKLFRGGNRRS